MSLHSEALDDLVALGKAFLRPSMELLATYRMCLIVRLRCGMRGLLPAPHRTGCDNDPGAPDSCMHTTNRHRVGRVPLRVLPALIVMN